MARIDNLENFLTDVAGSIKAKKGITEAIPAENFDTEIAGIPTGTVVEKVITEASEIVEEESAVKIDSNPIPEPIVVPENGTLEVLADKSLLAENIGLTAEKIIKGSTILDIEGVADGGGVVITDATATADDVLSPKVFYNNKGRTKGNMQWEPISANMVYTTATVENTGYYVLDYLETKQVGALVSSIGNSTLKICKLVDGVFDTVNCMNITAAEMGSAPNTWDGSYQNRASGFYSCRFNRKPLVGENVYELGMIPNQGSQETRWITILRLDLDALTYYSDSTYTSKVFTTHDVCYDVRYNTYYLTYNHPNRDREFIFVPVGTIRNTGSCCVVYSKVSGNSASRRELVAIGNTNRCGCFSYDGSYFFLNTLSGTNYKIINMNSLSVSSSFEGRKQCCKFGNYIWSGNSIYDINGNIIKSYSNISSNATYYQANEKMVYVFDYSNLYMYLYSESDDTFMLVDKIGLNGYNPLASNAYSSGISTAECVGTNILRFGYYGGDIMYVNFDFDSIVPGIITYKNTKLYNTCNTTAAANNILAGKIACIRDGEVEGTMQNNGELTYVCSAEPQIIPEGYTSGGIVNPATADVDANIIPDNIKKDVEILGVVGTYEPTGGDATSDANIQAKYLLEGYKAVSDGKWVEGEMVNYGTVTMERTSEIQEIPSGYYDSLTVPIAQAYNLDGYNECLDALIYITHGAPVSYTELNYIQSTGTQYIDTGITINKTDNVIIEQKCAISNDKYAGCNGYTQWTGDITNNVDSVVKVAYTSTNNTETIYVDGVQKTSNLWDNYNGSNVKIGIFKLGEEGNTWHESSAQVGILYYCKIHKNNKLVRDFVPAQRDEDSVVGLYDKVSKMFFVNDGTGNFVSGGVKE